MGDKVVGDIDRTVNMTSLHFHSRRKEQDGRRGAEIHIIILPNLCRLVMRAENRRDLMQYYLVL